MSDKNHPPELRSFTETYPDIAQLEIAVKLIDSGGKETKEKIFTDSNLPMQDISCGHPKCWGGGLGLDTLVSAISALYEDQSLESTDYIFCKGGRYSGSKRYGPCGWAFKLLLTVRYK